MGMMLGNRQLAMLREMGVRVWQPKVASNAGAAASSGLPNAVSTVDTPTQSHAVNTTDLIAARANIHSATGTKHTKNPIQPLPAAPALQAAPGTWVLGPAQELYATTTQQSSPRWLVLLEAVSDSLQGGFNALEGDAGTLLGNMLRAANMHASGGVTLMPLVRDAHLAGAVSADLHHALPEHIAGGHPTVVIVMGRLAAQAALQSNEPFAKLRGRVHQLHGTPCIVTLDPAYLLRKPLDKAKAWDDLCLALSVA